MRLFFAKNLFKINAQMGEFSENKEKTAFLILRGAVFQVIHITCAASQFNLRKLPLLYITECIMSTPFFHNLCKIFKTLVRENKKLMFGKIMLTKRKHYDIIKA